MAETGARLPHPGGGVLVGKDPIPPVSSHHATNVSPPHHPPTEAISKIPTTARRRILIKRLLPSFARPAETGSIQWEKFAHLLTSHHTTKLWDRHASVLERCSIVFAQGLPLIHLHPFAHILTLLEDRICAGGSAVLRPPLIKLLTVITSKPLINDQGDKHVEELKRDFIRFTSSVADLIAVDADTARGTSDTHTLPMFPAVVALLYKLCGGPRISAPVSCHRIVTYPWLLDKTDAPPSQRVRVTTTVQEAPDVAGLEQERELLDMMADARVVENITILLRMQDSMNVFASTTPKMPFADPFRILRRLSPSAACCLQMVQHNTLPVLANYLAHLTDEPTVSILIETLWNALECRHRESVATVLIHPDCISALATALRRLASATSSHMPREVDRACRNELALLCADIALFAPIDSVSEFLHTGFVDLLCDLLFGDELAWGDKASDTAEEEPPCPDDFAFKRQLMSLAMIFAEHPAMLDQMLQRGLLQFCILYLEFDSSNPMVNRWSLRQIKRLQHQITTLLQKIIVVRPSYTSRLLDPLQHFLSAAIDKDTNVASDDMANPNPTSDIVGLVNAVLQVLTVVSENAPELRGETGEMGLFPVLIDILSSNIHPPETHRTALLLITSLCQHPPNRALFGTSPPSSVPVLVNYLSFHSPSLPEQRLMHQTALTALWAAISFETQNECAFLKTSGLYTLLDLIASPNQCREIRMCGLGFLNDLMENPITKDFVNEWRGWPGGLVGLVVDLWVGEEKHLGIEQGPDGTVSEKEGNPLGSVRPLKDTTFTPVIREMNENLRAKLYSLLMHLQPVDTSALPTSHRIKLALIERYLDFKILDVYATLERSLHVEGVRPTTPDLEVVHAVWEVGHVKKKDVINEQKKILNELKETIKKEDALFYEQVKKREELKKAAHKQEKTRKQPTLPPLPTQHRVLARSSGTTA